MLFKDLQTMNLSFLSTGNNNLIFRQNNKWRQWHFASPFCGAWKFANLLSLNGKFNLYFARKKEGSWVVDDIWCHCIWVIQPHCKVANLRLSFSSGDPDLLPLFSVNLKFKLILSLPIFQFLFVFHWLLGVFFLCVPSWMKLIGVKCNYLLTSDFLHTSPPYFEAVSFGFSIVYKLFMDRTTKKRVNLTMQPLFLGT